MVSRSSHRKAFTIVELIVSIAIFAMMTALLVAKYGNFNNSVLLTNLAYDMAATIRTAQTYGLSVQGKEGVTGPSGFQYPYGVAFCISDADCPQATGQSGFNNTHIILFADIDRDNAYDHNDVPVAIYAIKRGVKINALCVAAPGGALTNCATSNNKRVDITFLRPSLDAIICVNYKYINDTGGTGFNYTNYPTINCAKVGFNTTYGKRYAILVSLKAPDGSTRGVVIRSTGQISVEDTGSAL